MRKDNVSLRGKCWEIITHTFKEFPFFSFMYVDFQQFTERQIHSHIFQHRCSEKSNLFSELVQIAQKTIYSPKKRTFQSFSGRYIFFPYIVYYLSRQSTIFSNSNTIFSNRFQICLKLVFFVICHKRKHILKQMQKTFKCF